MSLLEWLGRLFKSRKDVITKSTEVEKEAAPADPPTLVPPQNPAPLAQGPPSAPPPYLPALQHQIPPNPTQFGNGAPPQALGLPKSTQHPHQNQPPSAWVRNGPHGARVCSKAWKLPRGTNDRTIVQPHLDIWAIWFTKLEAMRYQLSEKLEEGPFEAESLIISGVNLRRAMGSDVNQHEFLAALERDVIGPARSIVAQKIKYKTDNLIFLRGEKWTSEAEEISQLLLYHLLGCKVNLTTHKSAVEKTYVGMFETMDDQHLVVAGVPYEVTDADLARKFWTITAHDEEEAAA